MSVTDKRKASFEQRFYAFWMAATPRIFEWFGWIAALGVAQYVYAKTNSNAVLGVLMFGYLALSCYTYALFNSKIQITAIKTKHHREFVSGLLALGLAYLTSVIAREVIDAFSRSAL